MYIILDMSNTIQSEVNEQNISSALFFFITLSQAFAAISRRFDHMGSMVGFNDFVILYHLHVAEDNKLRRIDLADKTGLTASGITRLLPALEKLKLIERQSDPRDARVSYVALTLGGQRVLTETMERAEHVAATVAPSLGEKEFTKFSGALNDMRRRSL